MQQHLAGQVLGRSELPAREQRLGAHREHQLAEETHGGAPGGLRRAVANGEIDAFALEILDLVGRREPHVDPRMHAAEVVEARHQPQRGEGNGGGHGEHAGLARAQPARDIAQQAQHFGRRLVQRLPLLGEAQLAVVAAEQRHAELLLQGLDLAADRGLGDEQLGGRLGEAQVTGGSLEAFQQVERRQIPGALKHSIYSCKR